MTFAFRAHNDTPLEREKKTSKPQLQHFTLCTLALALKSTLPQKFGVNRSSIKRTQVWMKLVMISYCLEDQNYSTGSEIIVTHGLERWIHKSERQLRLKVMGGLISHSGGGEGGEKEEKVFHRFLPAKLYPVVAPLLSTQISDPWDSQTRHSHAM